MSETDFEVGADLFGIYEAEAKSPESPSKSPEKPPRAMRSASMISPEEAPRDP